MTFRKSHVLWSERWEHDSPGQQHCYLRFLSAAACFLRQTSTCTVVLLHGSANIRDILTLVVHVTGVQNVHTTEVSKYQLLRTNLHLAASPRRTLLETFLAYFLTHGPPLSQYNCLWHCTANWIFAVTWLKNNSLQNTRMKQIHHQ